MAREILDPLAATIAKEQRILLEEAQQRYVDGFRRGIEADHLEHAGITGSPKAGTLWPATS